MACILLTNMAVPASCPSAQHNSLSLPEVDPATGLATKLDTVSTTCLTVHFYHPGNNGSEDSSSQSKLTFPAGEYVAEELCLSAAKACGKFQEESL